MHASLHTFPAANAGHDDISRMELRVLISAPTGRDASLIVNLLRSAGLAAEACSGYDHVEQQMTCGAGAVIIAEESLREQDVERLRSFLMRQPSWSDFPLILLTKGARSRLRRCVATKHTFCWETCCCWSAPSVRKH